MKVTRQLLESYRKIKREIPMLEAEIEGMRTGDTGIGSDTVLDYRKGYPQPQPVVGFDWKRYERRKKALEHKIQQVEAVESWIDAIEDGQTRCVFRMYYIEGMTWSKIAAKTGYANSPDYPRLYIRDKYLKEQGIL